MPDGSARPVPEQIPALTVSPGLEWSRLGDLAPDGDLVALQAAARFAELAVEAATKQAIAEAKTAAPEKPRDPADPLDQVAADWAATIEADERIIHAFLGIDDPIGREADQAFGEARVDASLEAFLERLPDTVLAAGELAALEAFDKALTNGSDAAEALSAAIEAAEQVDASAATAVGLALSPAGIGLGLETASFANPDPEQTGQSPEAPPPPPAPFVSSQPDGTFAAASLSPLAARDDAFGFGFQFLTEPLEPFVPASNRSRDSRREPVPDDDGAVAYETLIGSSASDLLVGGNGASALGGAAENDFLYGDRPDNYDAALHDPATPLADPAFSSTGGADILSGGAGDDALWGGAGDDQLHGDVPDTSSSLFAEFAFGLGATDAGDDSLYGGTGSDSLWGGGGADRLYGDEGDDYLSGDEGADRLYGGAGNDNIFGYAGDDIVQGGQGDDTLTGGDGADSFEFAGGSGAGVAERVQSLGVDQITDYSAAEGDAFALSDADFGLGNSGLLTAGSDYFEIADGSLGDSPLDLSGGGAGGAILVMGADSGDDGVGIYYTEDASAASQLNSYQIADIISVNASDFEAADFILKS